MQFIRRGAKYKVGNPRHLQFWGPTIQENQKKGWKEMGL